MNDFKEYSKNLADHEEKNSRSFLEPRERLLMNAGYRLNWIGDYIANPNIEFKLKDMDLAKI